MHWRLIQASLKKHTKVIKAEIEKEPNHIALHKGQPCRKKRLNKLTCQAISDESEFMEILFKRMLNWIFE